MKRKNLAEKVVEMKYQSLKFATFQVTKPIMAVFQNWLDSAKNI